MGAGSGSWTDPGMLQHFSRDAEEINNNKKNMRQRSREGGVTLGGYSSIEAK